MQRRPTGADQRHVRLRLEPPRPPRPLSVNFVDAIDPSNGLAVGIARALGAGLWRIFPVGAGRTFRRVSPGPPDPPVAQQGPVGGIMPVIRTHLSARQGFPGRDR